MVHILFNPLSYCVDVSRGVSKYGETLAAKVDEPLLTAEAKKMLLDTLTPLEMRVCVILSLCGDEVMCHCLAFENKGMCHCDGRWR